MRLSRLRSVRVPRVFYAHLYLGILLLGCTFLALQWLSVVISQDRGLATPLLTRLQELPWQMDGWKGAEAEFGQNIVTAPGVDDWTLRLYRHASGAAVWVYIGVVENVTFGARKSNHSPLICYPGQGWEPIQQGLQQITLPGGQSVHISRLLVQKDLEKRLVLYWYQRGGKITAEQNVLGSYLSRFSWLLQLPVMLLNHERTDHALVRISAPVVDSVEATLAREIALIQAIFPLLRQQFALDVSAS